MLRPCLDCGLPTPDSRCPQHQSAHEARRPPRRIKGRYDSHWLRLRGIAIRRHPWCENCGTPGEDSNPLTGDHRIPLARGGSNLIGNVAVLCRRCNSAKGAGIGASNL